MRQILSRYYKGKNLTEKRVNRTVLSVARYNMQYTEVVQTVELVFMDYSQSASQSVSRTLQ